MGVTSTPNLVSSETKKRITATSFQTLNSFVMSLDLMRREIESHANKKLLIFSFLIVELSKPP